MWAAPDPARDASVRAWTMPVSVSFGLASNGFFHEMAHYEVETPSEVKIKTPQWD